MPQGEDSLDMSLTVPPESSKERINTGTRDCGGQGVRCVDLKVLQCLDEMESD